MRIGILQAGQSPDMLKDSLGDYPDMFVRLLAGRGFRFDVYDVENMHFPSDVHDAEGWLITGSRHGVYEGHGFIAPLEDFIRRAYDAGVPLVGICFGHQIIAQALGGRVIKHPEGWAVGVQDYDFEGQRVTMNAWHQDQVVDLPADAQIVGRNDFCAAAALVYGDRAYSVQAHPEFDDAFIAGLIEHRARGKVPPDLLAGAVARMGQPKDSGLIADRIAAFFKQPRTQEARA